MNFARFIRQEHENAPLSFVAQFAQTLTVIASSSQLPASISVRYTKALQVTDKMDWGI